MTGVAARQACHDGGMSYWWWRYAEQLDAEDRNRQEWISEVKQRLGIVCWDDKTPSRPLPDWPVLPEGTRPGDWQTVSEQAMASLDGVNFYVKPDGMSFAEFLASLR